MKGKVVLLFFLLFLMMEKQGVAQSIAVNPPSAAESSMNLEDLIANVFLGGACNGTISNITVVSRDNVVYEDSNFITQGGASSYAYFTYAGSEFPINEGVILSNGAATENEGANILDPLSGTGVGGPVAFGIPDSDWPGDTDITTILNNRFGDSQTTNNATIVEFDFVPAASTFSFRYLFASDEYVNSDTNTLQSGFECSNFQDGFAFIVSGPGITDDPGITGKNIALLPDGVTPVSAGTIHNNIFNCAPAQNPSFYIDYSGANAATAPIEFNGRTILLTAQESVQPGETYHMKMVIADRDDNQFDSSVFLLADSFDVGSLFDLGNDFSLNCSGDEQTITINSNSPITGSIQWLLNGDIIPNENGVSITVNEQGDYTAIVSIAGCDYSDTVSVTVVNTSPTLAPITGNTEVCPGEFTTLTTSSADTGVTYQWQFNGDDISGETNPSITTNQTGQYTVVVSNGSGCTASENITVTEKLDCIIPNGISPDGDNLNDSFDIEWLNAANIKIYNRLGTKVYEKDNYKNEWFGQSEGGDELPTGTYYYVITVSEQSSVEDKSPITGWIYVNREK